MHKRELVVRQLEHFKVLFKPYADQANMFFVLKVAVL